MAGYDLDPKAVSPALARVARGDLCSGCGACALLAPGVVHMEETASGFLRPHQSGPVSTADEARIAKVCPGLSQTIKVANRQNHPLWGPYVTVGEGYAIDQDLRFAGASGGGLSGLLVHLLDSRKIDAVVQIAADPVNPLANQTVITTDRAGILEAAGSRYAPSAPLAALDPVLNDDKRQFAFVGKPCDVASLRALGDQDPRVSARIPVMLSFFCAGVPALAGAEAVLAALGTARSETVAFRYRGHGWPGRATALDDTGRERSMSYHDSWGGHLSGRVQHRCKICADGTGKAADVVFADSWRCDAQGYPLFEEADGISLIMARTSLGRDLLASAEAAGTLRQEDIDIEALAAMQPGQSGRRSVLAARLGALMLLGRPVPRYRSLSLLAAARHARVGALIRNFLGMVRRVINRH